MRLAVDGHRAALSVALNLAAVALLGASAPQADRAPGEGFNRDLYAALFASQVHNPQDIADAYELRQAALLPLALPDPVLPMLADGGVLPFSPREFSASFRKALVPADENGIRLYPIRVEQLPGTGERAILNARGEMLAVLPAPFDYDPLGFVRTAFPLAPETRQTWLAALYDPARISVSYRLIATDDLVKYVWTRSLSPPPLETMMLAQWSGTVTNLQIVAVTPASNGVEVVVAYPDDFDEDIDLYTRAVLTAGDWTLAITTNITAGTNLVGWLDASATGVVSRFYAAGSAVFDGDDDGLADAREHYLYGTDPENADSDGDLMADGWEVTHGLNALTPADQNTDADSDGLSNFGEYVLGTDPAVVDSDGDGVADAVEVQQGSSPADPDDEGDSKRCGMVDIFCDGYQDSWSELRVWDASGRTVLRQVANAYRGPGSSWFLHPFVKGKAYSFELRWWPQPNPICVPQSSWAFFNYAPDSLEGDHDEWVVAAPGGDLTPVILHDPDRVLGIHLTVDENGEKTAFAPEGMFGELFLLKVELFRDDACTKVLDDWPAEPGNPRSPKYVFGPENGIYVQVPGPSGLGDSYFTVKVASEADTTGIHLHLQETSPGIYRNCNASGSEVLYLDKTTHVGTANDIYLKVLEEEVLTFTLKASGTEVCSTDVKVDRAEIGVEWQSDYSTYDPMYGTLHTADDYANGVYANIGDANLVWAKDFNNGDLNSKESHFASSGDGTYADAEDMAVWCGHGLIAAGGSYMRFFVDLVGGVKHPPDQLFRSEIDWGDKDADWMVLNTCNFLNGTDAQLQAMASGVHLICGYATDMTVFAAAGEYFADQLEERKIRDAWHRQCEQYQPSGNTARVFGASDNGNETFQYGGPVLVARDPTSSSTYTHWDYTKP